MFRRGLVVRARNGAVSLLPSTTSCSFCCNKSLCSTATANAASSVNNHPPPNTSVPIEEEAPKKKRRIFTRRNFVRLGILALVATPINAIIKATDPKEQPPRRYGKWEVLYATSSDPIEDEYQDGAEKGTALCGKYTSCSTTDFEQSFHAPLIRVDNDTRDGCQLTTGFMRNIAEGLTHWEVSWARPQVDVWLARCFLFGFGNHSIRYHQHDLNSVVAIVDEDGREVCTSIVFKKLVNVSALRGPQLKGPTQSETEDGNPTKPPPYAVLTFTTRVGCGNYLSRLRLLFLSRFTPSLVTAAVLQALKEEPVFHSLN